jgi:hypothetical protein
MLHVLSLQAPPGNVGTTREWQGLNTWLRFISTCAFIKQPYWPRRAWPPCHLQLHVAETKGRRMAPIISRREAWIQILCLQHWIRYLLVCTKILRDRNSYMWWSDLKKMRCCFKMYKHFNSNISYCLITYKHVCFILLRHECTRTFHQRTSRPSG